MARPGDGPPHMLVAERISGGLELVLGVQRDLEIGPVVMFGTGGVLLELYKDVSFGAVPLASCQFAFSYTCAAAPAHLSPAPTTTNMPISPTVEATA